MHNCRIRVSDELDFDENDTVLRCIDKYDILHTLSDSKFHRIYKAKSKDHPNSIVILKQIDVDVDNDQNFPADCMGVSIDITSTVSKEVNILKQIAHPNIIKLNDYFCHLSSDGASVYQVLEYAIYGPLMHVQKFITDPITHQIKPIYTCTYTNSSTIGESYLSKIVEQLFSAVSYLHHQHIVHRDIKIENILISYHGHIKLSDFEYAENLYALHHHHMNTTTCSNTCNSTTTAATTTTTTTTTAIVPPPPLPMANTNINDHTSKDYQNKNIKNNLNAFLHELNECYEAASISNSDSNKCTFYLSDTVGTWLYWAPELCQDNDNGLCYDPYKIDIWAIGICIWICIYGTPPYYSDSPIELFEMIMQWKYCISIIPFRPSNELMEILINLLSYNPQDRDSCEELLQYKFITDRYTDINTSVSASSLSLQNAHACFTMKLSLCSYIQLKLWIIRARNKVMSHILRLQSNEHTMITTSSTNEIPPNTCNSTPIFAVHKNDKFKLKPLSSCVIS